MAGSREAWSSPGEEIRVGAAVGRGDSGRSLCVLRGPGPAKRGWGQGADPSLLPRLSTAPHPPVPARGKGSQAVGYKQQLLLP